MSRSSNLRICDYDEPGGINFFTVSVPLVILSAVDRLIPQADPWHRWRGRSQLSSGTSASNVKIREVVLLEQRPPVAIEQASQCGGLEASHSLG